MGNDKDVPARIKRSHNRMIGVPRQIDVPMNEVTMNEVTLY
jgi:hypothetical protein